MPRPLPDIECAYFAEEFIRLLRDGEPPKFPHPVPTLRYLYELCWSMVFKNLPFQKFKAALDAAQFSDPPSEEDLASYLADVVSQIAQDTNMPEENRIRVVRLAKWFVDSALVPLRFLQERCEEEFLKQADMMKMSTAQDLKSKEVRVNTRLLYQQTKFNLLREEIEGYAKLVALLCQGSETSSKNHSASTIGIIKSLIGHFDLDPNRIFDIVLDCFELQPSNDLFLDLIPIFPKSNASQILGFKFQYYQRLEVQSPVPFSLYQLAALLIKEDFVDLDIIYAHLLPKDEEAFEHYNAFAAKRLDEANKIGRINLAATGKDLMDDDKLGDVTIDLYTAVDMETKAVAERSAEFENSQSLGLLTGFLSVDDWHHANLLFERLSPLNPAAHIKICDGLFRLIEKSISSAYDIVHRRHLQKSGLTAVSTDDIDATGSSVYSSLVVLPKGLFQMLSCVGPYLYRDTVLLQKVCSVLKGYYLSALEVDGQQTGAFESWSHCGGDLIACLQLRDVRLEIEDALGSCLLPSLHLVPANPAVGHAIWEVMCHLPFETRYRLYEEWEKCDEWNPMIVEARQTAKLDTRRILKRLAKENMKQLGRMVAKLAHASPMTVLRTIVHQIESYKDMIAPVVDAFKYLTKLEYDALEYVVIERLAQGGRQKLKEDGLNLSDWLQSLASFWGHLCKKYPSMELRGLFQYLVNQLERGQGIELNLLQELIQQMANVQYTENMTEAQLDAMSGGESLRCQATSFGITRNNKALIKSTSRLRDSLCSEAQPELEPLAVQLLLHIAKHRSLIVINADAPDIKIVSEQYDRCHGVLLQYVEFLCSAMNPATAYAQLLPSLDGLVHKYHLEPEVAFLIYRPVMRLFKCPSGSGFFWPLCDSEAGEASLSRKQSDMSVHGDLVLDLGSSHKPIRWSSLLDTVRSMLPPESWNRLSPDLYATFWGLTLYDLYVPRCRYESEIGKLHGSLKALDELSDKSCIAIAKRKKDEDRIQESLDRLKSELQRHEENVASVRRRLALEKDTWLSKCPDVSMFNMEFLYRCIFPRCTLSAPDAIYCALFVQTLHSLGTPFFNTFKHIDVLICKFLHPMICCCTEYEVARVGRLVYETLKTAYYWKSDESVYKREFTTFYNIQNCPRVPFAKFCRVHRKWSSLITKILEKCLESAEYMEIRNALIMLTKISSVFPATCNDGITILKLVAKIKSNEREDLKVLATSVSAALAARKSAWVIDSPASVINGIALVHGTVMRSEGGAANSSESKGFLKDDSAKVSEVSRPAHARSIPSPKQDGIKAADKQQKRTSPAEDPGRSTKRRKGDSDKERMSDARSVVNSKHVDVYKPGPEEENVSCGADKHLELSKDKIGDKHDRERSIERGTDRIFDRVGDKSKDEKIKEARGKVRHNELPVENLPPLPPRKREGREVKVNDRKGERANLVKEDVDSTAALKRRELNCVAGVEPGEYCPGALAPALPIRLSHDYYGRERAERKRSMVQHPAHFADPGIRFHGKEAPGKMARRDVDPMYNREWEDEKRQRVEPKQCRHRK